MYNSSFHMSTAKKVCYGVSLLGITALGFNGQRVWALPSGGNVIHGDIKLEQVGNNQLNIHQTSERGVIHWENFSISSGNWVNFIQPGTNAATLNRVVGNLPSEIAGKLTANGNIFLVNPNGIAFLQGAQVNVGGLVASTLDLDSHKFLTGHEFNFRNSLDKGDGVGKGITIAQGAEIKGREGGDIVFIAPGFDNKGTVEVPKGTITVAVGDEVKVRDLGLGFGTPSFIITPTKTSSVRDTSGNELSKRIHNEGKLLAAGGTVTLAAHTEKDVKGLVQNVINLDGVVDVRDVKKEDIRLRSKVQVQGFGDTDVHINGVVKGDEIIIRGENQEISGRLEGKNKISIGDTASLEPPTPLPTYLPTEEYERLTNPEITFAREWPNKEVPIYPIDYEGMGKVKTTFISNNAVLKGGDVITIQSTDSLNIEGKIITPKLVLSTETLELVVYSKHPGSIPRGTPGVLVFNENLVKLEKLTPEQMDTVSYPTPPVERIEETELASGNVVNDSGSTEDLNELYALIRMYKDYDKKLEQVDNDSASTEVSETIPEPILPVERIEGTENDSVRIYEVEMGRVYEDSARPISPQPISPVERISGHTVNANAMNDSAPKGDPRIATTLAPTPLISRPGTDVGQPAPVTPITITPRPGTVVTSHKNLPNTERLTPEQVALVERVAQILPDDAAYLAELFATMSQPPTSTNSVTRQATNLSRMEILNMSTEGRLTPEQVTLVERAAQVLPENASYLEELFPTIRLLRERNESPFNW